jgi:hypothetical protein
MTDDDEKSARTLVVHPTDGLVLHDSHDREISIRRQIGYGAQMKKPAPKANPYTTKMPMKKGGKKGCK